MIFCTNISPAFETTSSEAGQEHLEGIIEISLDPPLNLEIPNFYTELELTINLVIIYADKRTRLKGKRALWDKVLWQIEDVKQTGRITRNLKLRRIDTGNII